MVAFREIELFFFFFHLKIVSVWKAAIVSDHKILHLI